MSTSPRIGATIPPAQQQAVDQGSELLWTATVGGMVGCVVPLLLGIGGGWSLPRVLIYAGLSAAFIALTQAPRLPGLCRLLDPLWIYLVLMGGLGFVLQGLSGDPFLQPIVFIVPFVFASFEYGTRGKIGAGLIFLALMSLSLWLGGARGNLSFVLPVIGYAALMMLVSGFTTMSEQQTAARNHADHLAADLARQRDYLARLVDVTASLTRDLDLETVLAQVAAEGQILARAGQVRVWLREAVDEDDPPMRLAAAVPAQLAAQTPDNPILRLPLHFKNEPIGVLELMRGMDGPFTDEDARLLRPFADAAAVAIENARLYEQARLLATLAERNRLARELHDTIAQGLTAVNMQLEAAQRSFDRDSERARTRLARASELTKATLEDVRRSVWTLAAPLIDGHALSESLADLVQRFEQRTAIAAHYEHTGAAPTLGHAQATQVLRIVQEALQNVEKHARATVVSVQSEAMSDALQIRVRDNGVGFDPASPPGGAGGSGFGLISLGERARLSGGMIDVRSVPGAGTCVTLTIPQPDRSPSDAARKDELIYANPNLDR